MKITSLSLTLTEQHRMSYQMGQYDWCETSICIRVSGTVGVTVNCELTVNKVRLFPQTSSVLLVIGTNNQQQHETVLDEYCGYSLSNYQREFRCAVQFI